MGIKSTRYVSRDLAIGRIKEIDYLLFHKRYLDIESITSEHDYKADKFIHTRAALLDSGEELDITQWTDDMLTDKLDEPFYRYSMFESYLIESATT